MSLAQARKSDMKRLLRDLRGGASLLIVGAGLGGSAFLLLDAMTEPAPKPVREAAFSLRSNVFYSTCRDAILDGRTNIRRGELGYRAELDADNDGLACEPYRGL